MKKVVKNMFLVTKGGPQNSGLHALIRMGAPLVITLHTSLICAGNGWGCHFAEYGGTCLGGAVCRARLFQLGTLFCS